MFKNILTIFISIIICVGIGLASQQLQTEALNNWYPFLAKSQITPPDYVFPIVWGILYILMGISIGLILLTQEIKKKQLSSSVSPSIGIEFCMEFFLLLFGKSGIRNRYHSAIRRSCIWIHIQSISSKKSFCLFILPLHSMAIFGYLPKLVYFCQ